MSSVEPEASVVNTPGESEGVPGVENDIIKEETAGSESEAKAVDVEQISKNFQEKARNYLIEQTGHVVIPSYGKWFNMNEINSIEKKLFPDFFPPREDGAKSVYKTAEVYKNMRDFMINAYRINPLEYLSITAVRRSLAGDVTSIIRIHQFLERWGLINYQIDPRTKPSTVGPQYTGHFQITLDTPKGLVPFIPEHKDVINGKSSNPNVLSDSSEQPSQKAESDSKEIPLNLEARRNIYSSSDDSYNSSNIIQYFCNICGKDTSEVRFHNLKVKSYSSNPNSTFNKASILCMNCFEQGLFPLNFQASDFIKLDQPSDRTWSEQEILLLMEGIEMFGSFDVQNGAVGGHGGSLNSNPNGQWDKISEFVGTKSKEQCLIKFIQLPIEDRYLNKLINGSKENGKSIDKATLVQDIAKEVVLKAEGKEIIKENSINSLKESIVEQSDLINQVIELTLKKVDVKLDTLDTLESSLLEVERQRNLERKQILIERWHQFEKINKLKQQRPELASILDDLLTPVSINEINKSLKESDEEGKQGDQINGASLVINSTENNETTREHLPISVVQPKSYEFWSG